MTLIDATLALWLLGLNAPRRDRAARRKFCRRAAMRLPLLLTLPAVAQSACILALPARVELPAAIPAEPGAAHVLTTPLPVPLGFDGTPCVALIGIRASSGVLQLDGPGGTLPLVLRVGPGDAAAVRDLPVATPAELLRGTAGPGGVTPVAWAGTVGAASLAPGLYETSLQVNLYEAEAGAPQSARWRESRTLRLSQRVPAWLRATLGVDGHVTAFGVPRQLDLGELSEGVRREFVMTVEGNVRYTITMLAEQLSRLRRQSRPGTAPAYVPYRVEVIEQRDEAGGRGVLRVAIVVGTVSGAPPGDYAGALMLTVKAL